MAAASTLACRPWVRGRLRERRRVVWWRVGEELWWRVLWWRVGEELW